MSLGKKFLQRMVLKMAAWVRFIGTRIIFAGYNSFIGFRRGTLKNWGSVDRSEEGLEGWNEMGKVQPGAVAQKGAGMHREHVLD